MSTCNHLGRDSSGRSVTKQKCGANFRLFCGRFRRTLTEINYRYYSTLGLIWSNYTENRFVSHDQCTNGKNIRNPSVDETANFPQRTTKTLSRYVMSRRTSTKIVKKLVYKQKAPRKFLIKLSGRLPWEACFCCLDDPLWSF